MGKSEIKAYLQTHKLMTDGAFGTYFATLAGEEMLPEKANTEDAESVGKVHRAYLEAGARLIRTNTFASNTETLLCSLDKLQENISAAVEIARKEIEVYQKQNPETHVILAGDIGPIPVHRETGEQAVKEEYRRICATFLEKKVDAIVFETFSDLDLIEDVICYIKEQNPEVFVITQFSVNQLGYTNAGLSAKSVLTEADAFAKKGQLIDAVGFNCGVGPGHLYQILKGLNLSTELYLTALPNASYPKIIQNRVVFLENMEYFGEKMAEIADMGIDILGGCCGTNPSYIRKLSEKVKELPFSSGVEKRRETFSLMATEQELENKHCHISPKAFFAGKETGAKLIAVELSPPPNAEDEKIMEAAHLLEHFQVDCVTLPDSPSGRTRADSILMAAKIARETNLNVMPHVCCRDKNAIAIRSQLLGAYINQVRNVLLITGDPVPTMIRSDVKSVFNFDSVGLMKILNEMNQGEFEQDPIAFGGAINHNRLNLDVEMKRVQRKMETGATFFMTQPVFSDADVIKLRRIKEETNARILCGIMPLVSLKNATFIKNEMAGIEVTEEIIEKFHADMSRQEGEQVGVSIAREVMEKTKDIVDGYYFSIPFNRVYLLQDILK